MSHHRPARSAVAVIACAGFLGFAAVGAQEHPPISVEGDSADVAMLMRGAQPAVQVTVNTKGPYVFAIDTGGAGLSRADQSLVASLALPTVGEARASDGSGTGVRTIPIVRIETLQLGGITWRPVDAPSRDYNSSPSLPRIDGILGFGAFSDFLLTLDFPHRRVRLDRGHLPPADGKTILPMSEDRGIPHVEITLGGEKVSADLDTGNIAGDAIHVAPSIASSLSLTGPAHGSGTVQTIAGSADVRRATLTAPICLGQYCLDSSDITIDPLTRTANIGSPSLKDFVVTLDQQSHLVRLYKP